MLTQAVPSLYLTIRAVALDGEGSNCFSITQLVGQKGNNKDSKWGKKTKEKPGNFATR